MDKHKIKVIYDALQDEESRFIFGHRILYSLTQDETYIRDIVNQIPEVQWLRAEIMRSHKNFVFGAGGYGKVVRQLAPAYWKGILDNDNQKWGGLLRWRADSLAGDNPPAPRCPCFLSRSPLWQEVSSGNREAARRHGDRSLSHHPR